MSIEEACNTIVKDCMNIKKNEKVLVISDEKSLSIGKAIFKKCKEIGAEAAHLEIIERKNHGEELPEFIATAMKSSNVVIAPTTKSLSHTKARKEACKAGTRVASMPGITENMLERTLNADYKNMAILTNKLAEILNDGENVILNSPGGTKIKFEINRRKGIADTGILHNKGDFGNLPAGEAYIAPLEGTANGVVVFDGAVAGIEKVDEPIIIEVADGKLTDIKGGKAAEEFRKVVFSNKNENSKNLAELGIGTNLKARLNSSLLEVEKVMKTVHIAFGDNASMGGEISAPIHIDGVILKPTLIIDNRTIIKNGEIKV